MNYFRNFLGEATKSVLPISAIVLLLSISAAPLNSGVLVLFIFGTLMLIFGMGFFSVGTGISMEPLGEGIGITVSKSKKPLIAILICFVLGVIITVAEPDLTVLAHQVPSISNMTLILCVSLGVGIFLALAMVRNLKNINLSVLLWIFYTVISIVSFFAPNEFVPTAFDSGGVTTGPITVPFIMALGAGLATVNGDKHSTENSFGLVSLCSIGPILSVLILSICFNPSPETTTSIIPQINTTRDAFLAFWHAVPHYSKEVLIAFFPIVGVFIVFQLISKRFHRHQLAKIIVGLIYTYIGLVMFLTGANIGFMPAGKLIGAALAESNKSYLLVPVGLLMGYFVVSAEPAVHSLKKQVSEVTNGAISENSIGIALSVGVGVSVALSMLRVLTGIPLMPFLITGYITSLTITFFVPHIYTGIAFDSGGVASGPMTTTFILPFATGACEALGGNIMTDAFGIVAMIAMTPLITIQLLGLSSNIRRKLMLRKAHDEFSQIKDDIIYYEEESL